MNIEAILARVKSVRRKGNSWMALCPAHPDKNRSLSIRLENGRVLLHCFAGCTVGDICAVSGIQIHELFADSAGDNERRIVAEYAYLDEKGRLLFQVVRFEPKTFRQRRPDGKGAGTGT